MNFIICHLKLQLRHRRMIGANLNEAHLMLTSSIYDERNKTICNKQNIQKPWYQRFWEILTYPLSCCYQSNNDESTNNKEIVNSSEHEKNPIQINKTSETKEQTKEETKGEYVDDGLTKIPQNVFENRLQALIDIRAQQDREFAIGRENAQIAFDTFNKKRNEEVNEQFKQMQKEKGY